MSIPAGTFGARVPLHHMVTCAVPQQGLEESEGLEVPLAGDGVTMTPAVTLSRHEAAEGLNTE